MLCDLKQSTKFCCHSAYIHLKAPEQLLQLLEEPRDPHEVCCAVHLEFMLAAVCGHPVGTAMS